MEPFVDGFGRCSRFKHQAANSKQPPGIKQQAPSIKLLACLPTKLVGYQAWNYQKDRFGWWSNRTREQERNYHVRWNQQKLDRRIGGNGWGVEGLASLRTHFHFILLSRWVQFEITLNSLLFHFDSLGFYFDIILILLWFHIALIRFRKDGTLKSMWASHRKTKQTIKSGFFFAKSKKKVPQSDPFSSFRGKGYPRQQNQANRCRSTRLGEKDTPDRIHFEFTLFLL